MKWFKNLLKTLFVLYVLLCGILYFIQDSLLFHPDKLPENYVFRTGEEVEVPVEKDLSLNCLWEKVPNSKGVILYLHGNRGSNRRCLRQAETFMGNDHDIFLVDYRGYGKSDGKVLSDDQLFRDVQKVYDFLKKHYDEKDIVLVGYSMGSGMAAYLAGHNQPQQVILVAPYFSMVDMKNRYVPFIPNFILKYQLCSNQFLAKSTCSITLFHGTLDEVIPYNSSEKLLQVQPERTQLITLKNVSHRGAIFHSSVRNTVRKLLR